MRYAVLGEPFPERVRTRLLEQASVPRTTPLLFSVYGSADTGFLGVESSASVALRQLLDSNPALNESLGVGPVVPHLFHVAAPDAYLETVAGELCVTRWQGIPLVRYNLHDAAALWDWSEVRQTVLSSPHLRPTDRDLVEVIAGAGQSLTDLLVIHGRADRTLILCGTNLTEAMFDQAVKSPALEAYLTGNYRVRLHYDGDRQRLALDLEFRQETPPDPETVDLVYERFVQTLGEAQPEFRDDWQNVYRVWDHDPDRRIVKLQGVPRGQLAKGEPARIKQRGVEL
jgi:phenylacetate-CoA ligase